MGTNWGHCCSVRFNDMKPPPCNYSNLFSAFLLFVFSLFFTSPRLRCRHSPIDCPLHPVIPFHLRASRRFGVRSRRPHVQREQRAHPAGERQRRRRPHHLRRWSSISYHGEQEDWEGSAGFVWVSWEMGVVRVGNAGGRDEGETNVCGKCNVKAQTAPLSFYISPLTFF